MKMKQILPTVIVASILVGGGAVFVAAQESGATRGEEAVHRTEFRDGGRTHHRAGLRFGRGGDEMLREIFNQVDADGDGAVTQAEIDTFRAARVAEADASGDGALSLEEFETVYRSFTRNRMVDAFQRLDADGDGVISADEMATRFGNLVEQLDRNDDGALSLEDRRRRG